MAAWQQDGYGWHHDHMAGVMTRRRVPGSAQVVIVKED